MSDYLQLWNVVNTFYFISNVRAFAEVRLVEKVLPKCLKIEVCLPALLGKEWHFVTNE